MANPKRCTNKALGKPTTQTRTSKMGRPRTNGLKPAHVLFRSALALSHFDDGLLLLGKRYLAIEYAVTALRKDFPDLNMSATELKRVLHEFRPHGVKVVKFSPMTHDDVEHELASVRCIVESYRPEFERMKRLGVTFPEFPLSNRFSGIKMAVDSPPE